MGKLSISVEEVEKIAKLSKMDIKGEEERFAELFTDTLTRIQDLNEIDTKDISETFQVTGLTNIFQEDLKENKNSLNENSLTKEEALFNSKETTKGLFTTKGVFVKEEDAF
jgi:aspartyl/glutamyl-tRNA(Asn/Gln) amidotransferase C subunit